MSKEAKIGLLLGLVFIVAIAVVLRGVHRDSLTILDESVEFSKALPEFSETVPLSSVVEQLSSDHYPVVERRRVASSNVASQEVSGSVSVSSSGEISIEPEVSASDSGQVRFVREIPNSSGRVVMAVTQSRSAAREQSPGPVIMPPSGAIDRAVANIGHQKTVVPAPVRVAGASKKHVVRKGDDLSSIAVKFYGQSEGNRLVNIERIYNANRKTMRSIDEIQVGQQLIIPALNVNASRSIKILDSRSVNVPASNKKKYYVVQAGDSLWSIAAKKLGDGKRFGDIVRLNSKILSDEDSVYPGLRLQMP